MNRISSERASNPSNLLRERLDGFDALSDDIRFIYCPVPQVLPPLSFVVVDADVGPG